MQRPDFKEGVRLGLFLFLVNVSFAVGSYILECWIFNQGDCSIASGWNWILQHPVFPFMIPVGTLIGFLIGAFGHIFFLAIPRPVQNWVVHGKGAIAWVFVVLLIAAFALWGLPSVFFLMQQ